MNVAGRDGAGSASIVQLDGYEGPIDFVLDLARAQKVDLGRLSIVALVDQYVAAVEAPGARATLAERGDWLIAASWLVLLKSKLLVQTEDEPEVPEAERLREGLVRAQQRRQARELTGWLERRPQLGQEVFACGAPEAAPASSSGESGDLLDLLLACFDLMDVPARTKREVAQPYAPPLLDVWTLAEALERLRARLSEQPEGG
ncbi:segregation/condensation protein A [Roseomonas sp. KE2513]|uniref:segregation/condensation protein A n=1 Tax=Roseomonas sp. KE2513 TaxID=2479202 RepID=UPI0018DFB389|nr:segregation/condensation protein A [Roseomonas sp. KE2513]